METTTNLIDTLFPAGVCGHEHNGQTCHKQPGHDGPHASAERIWYPKDPAAVSLGRKGGQAKSEAKTKAAKANVEKRWAASRANGAKGGRPRTSLYAVQVYNADTEAWEYVHPAPLSRETATAEVKRQRQWARDDATGKRYRSIRVDLT